MYEKSIGAMKARMPVLEYNCYENKPTTDRLDSKDNPSIYIKLDNQTSFEMRSNRIILH